MLLAGEDGGPEALRFRFDDSPSVYGHMHLTSQFQLLLNGAMDFPRGVKHLEALAIHYTDHNMPYGPFAVSGGHDMLDCTRKPAASSRCRISMRGARLISAGAFLPHWRPIRPGSPCPGVPDGSFKLLMPTDYGPAAVIVKAPAHASLAMPAAEFGRYEVVLDGSVIMEGGPIAAPGFRYVRGERPPTRWSPRSTAQPSPF